jgi:hypothetical protein
MIEDFSVITHEGLTTLAHSSRMVWTITSGTWNHLSWVPTPATLTKIQASCKSQECLEESNNLTPTRQVLLTLKQTCLLLRISIQERGMLVGDTGPKNGTCVGFYGRPRQTKIVDRSPLGTLSTGWCGKLRTRLGPRTHTLRREGFHRLLSFSKEEKENVSGFKTRGWCRRGDINVTKQKSTFECWVKSPAEAPRETLDCHYKDLSDSTTAELRQRLLHH